MSTKEELVYLAKLSEKAERYDEMVKHMMAVSRLGEELSIEERNLLSVAFKNLIGSRRVAWRVMKNIESKEKAKNSEQRVQIICEYRTKIEEEMRKICTDIFSLLDDILIPNSSSGELKVFFYKMKGDYYRYLAEFTKEQADINSSLKAYEEASAIATTELASTHPIRLGLALNFSVFYYEIMDDPKAACDLAKKSFDAAITELDALPEDCYKDSTLIMQLLRDNLNLWVSEQEEITDSNK